jgi:hypothetical protein
MSIEIADDETEAWLDTGHVHVLEEYLLRYVRLGHKDTIEAAMQFCEEHELSVENEDEELGRLVSEVRKLFSLRNKRVKGRVRRGRPRRIEEHLIRHTRVDRIMDEAKEQGENLTRDEAADLVSRMSPATSKDSVLKSYVLVERLD